MTQRETFGIDARTTPESLAKSDTRPVRTCIGCRKRELAVVLLRIVVASDESHVGSDVHTILVDTTGNLPGRGAWLHPDPQCLDVAIRRRAFARALRITGPQDTSAVIEHVGSPSGVPASRSATAREQVAKNMSTP